MTADAQPLSTTWAATHMGTCLPHVSAPSALPPLLLPPLLGERDHVDGMVCGLKKPLLKWDAHTAHTAPLTRYQAVQPPLEMTYPGGGRGGTQVSGDWTWTPSRYAQANQFRARGAQSLCQSSGGTHFGPYG